MENNLQEIFLIGPDLWIKGFDWVGFRQDLDRLHIQQTVGADKWAEIIAVIEFDQMDPWTTC